MKTLVIVGAGGFGREVAWTVRRINEVSGEQKWDIAGFADDAPDCKGGCVAGLPVVGSVGEACVKFPDAAYFIAIGDPRVRAAVKVRLGEREFPAVVDPSAIVSETAKIGEGVFVGPLSIVSTDASVGEFAVVNARAGVGHDACVGPFATISPGVSLSGFTKVGAFAFMGTNSSTVPSAEIGEGAAVSAGMPVYRSVPAGSTLSPFGTFRA